MEKSAVIARIRALLAKTVDNGATEAEAMSAAMKARELMEKYQISLSETQLREQGCDTGTHAGYKGGFNVPTRLSVCIAEFCDCRVWRSQGDIKFFGLQSDVDFATWLLAALEAFCWAQADAYQAKKRASGERTDWTDRRSFVQGCVGRINERLKEETAKRKQATISNGRALVVVKKEIVEKEFAGLGMRLRTRSISEARANGAAYRAGERAGSRAGFGRPMGGGARGAIAS